MTIHLTFDRVSEALDRVVEAKGRDFVYQPVLAVGCQDRTGTPRPTCTMWDVVGRPSCIVGQVFDLCGISRTMFETKDWRADIDTTLSSGVVDMDWPTRQLLATAQYKQDSGSPYGDAVDEAREVVRLALRDCPERIGAPAFEYGTFASVDDFHWEKDHKDF